MHGKPRAASHPQAAEKQAQQLLQEAQRHRHLCGFLEARIVIPCRFPFDWDAGNSQLGHPS